MTTQQTKAVDWSQPIEAWHEDGRVVAGEASLPDVDGDRRFNQLLDGKSRLFGVNGAPWKPSGWRVRNVAQPEAPTPSPELTARMVALVRELANSRYGIALADKARAILAELEPVDPVEAAADEVVGKLLKRGYLFANPQQALEVARLGVEAGRALAEAGK